MESLDPRVNRIHPDEDINESEPDHSNWDSYEVFHQAKRGKQHLHVGTLRAPSREIAMILAKEQYARRQTCVSLWVVKTTDVFISGHNDEDIFETTPSKIHREAAGYKVRDRIEAYKQKQAKKG